MALPTVRAATQVYNSRIPLKPQGVFTTAQIPLGEYIFGKMFFVGKFEHRVNKSIFELDKI